MLVISGSLIEGYSEDVRRRLEERLTDVAHVTIGAPFDGIAVIINVVPEANYLRARAGQ